jgi:ferredoxin-NADP reductase
MSMVGEQAHSNPTLPRPRAGEFGGWSNPLRCARLAWWLVTIELNLGLLPFVAAARGTEAALVAVLLAVAARHDGLVTAVSRLTVSFPGYRRHQMIYHLGQLHRAMAIAGIGWLVVAMAGLVGDPRARLILAGVVVALAAMAWTARDAVRGSRHERFEAIHRYCGWSVLVVLVALVGQRLVAGWSAGAPGRAAPSALLLLAVVALVAHPWLGVRRVPVEVLEVTPGLVVLTLPGRRRVGEFVRVSLDGHEWHSFAVSTCGREGRDRYCLVIRRAGDWTERLGRLAESGRPPTSVLVRRVRGFGFMGHAQTYERVLVIATGAGIGPVLLYLLDRRQPGLHCLWIGRDHRRTIGNDLVDRVVAGGQVTLVDTAAGRPDIRALVAEHASGVEAVFVVSNADVRDQVAGVCGRLGVPWYGPTFDS